MADERFAEVYPILSRVYGHDIVHEAVLLALEQQASPLAPRVRFLCQRLAQAGYHDGQLSRAHQHTWGRERLPREPWTMDHAARALWHQWPRTPEELAVMREALRALPEWLVELHLKSGTVKRAWCPHQPRWWYPYASAAGLAIRCRRCTAVRTAQRRAKVRCDL